MCFDELSKLRLRDEYGYQVLKNEVALSSHDALIRSAPPLPFVRLSVYPTSTSPFS